MTRRRSGADLLALLLGVGLVFVLVLLAATALIDAAQGNGGSRPSENLTQLLAAGVGGIVGALAGYLGRGALDRRGTDPDDPEPEGLGSDDVPADVPGREEKP